MLPIRDSSQIERYIQTKKKGWKKIFHANGKGKILGVAIVIPNKIDFKIKTIVRDKEGTTNNKGNNPTSGYNPSKHLYTQHGST